MSLERNQLSRHLGGGGARSERQTYIKANDIRNNSVVVEDGGGTIEYTVQIHLSGLLTLTPVKKGKGQGQKKKDVRPQGWVVIRQPG